jgi:LSD1 subclass zinc finger protein
MAVTLVCPNLKCRSVLQVPDNARGRKVVCSLCRTTFFVPKTKPATAGSAADKPATSNSS